MGIEFQVDGYFPSMLGRVCLHYLLTLDEKAYSFFAGKASFPLVGSLPLVVCSGSAVQEAKRKTFEVPGLYWKTVCSPTQSFLRHFARLEGRLM